MRRHMDIKKELLDIYNNIHPKSRMRVLKLKNELCNALVDKYPSIPLIEAFFCVINDIEPEVCSYGNKKSFSTLEIGYRSFCSTPDKCKCRRDSQREKILEYQKSLPENIRVEQQLKAKQTFMKKYLVENPMKLSEIKEKQQATMLEKYGVRFANQSDDLKFQHYKNLTGYASPLHNPKVQQKSKETYKNRYGSMMIHARGAVYEKYNGNPFTDSEIIKKSKQTLYKKYGVDHPKKSKEVLEKSKRKMIEQYGCENTLQMHISKESLEILNSKQLLSELYLSKTVKELALDLKVNYTTVLNRLLSMDIKNPVEYSPEIIIKNFLDNANIFYEFKNRSIIKPYELDFYLPEYQLAIEHCGLYWHSSIFKDSDYHIQKYNLCNKKGVRLITIFEDELVYKREIVLSTLRSILGKTLEKIYARKCNILIQKTKDIRHFIDNNHLQGSVDTASIHVCLEYKKEIIAVMSFRKTKELEYELVRYCTLNNSSVVGGASKCFSYFLKEYKSRTIVSFSDNRWFTGNMYIKLGFLDKTLRNSPDYYYIDGLHRIHKFNMRKIKLQKRFNIEDIGSKTELQITTDLNIPRIYDCGKKKWVWERN